MFALGTDREVVEVFFRFGKQLVADQSLGTRLQYRVAVYTSPKRRHHTKEIKTPKHFNELRPRIRRPHAVAASDNVSLQEPAVFVRSVRLSPEEILASSSS